MKKCSIVFSIVIVFLISFANDSIGQVKKKTSTLKKKKPVAAAVIKDSTTIVKLICPANFPTVQFAGTAATLSSDAQIILKTIVKQLKDNPEVKLNVTLYSAKTKSGLVLCNRRGQVIKDFLTEKEGISFDRVTLDCVITDTSANTVDFQCE